MKTNNNFVIVITDILVVLFVIIVKINFLDPYEYQFVFIYFIQPFYHYL